MIEIIDEPNADWWSGRCRGRQGLFPSNYVEKLDAAAPAHVPPPMPAFSPAYTPGYAAPPPQPYGAPAPYMAGPPPSEKPVYRPFGATYAGYDQPPPAQAPVAAPAPVNSVGLQQDPGQEKKKSKFGKLGGTVSVMPNLHWHCIEASCRWPILRLVALGSVRVPRSEVASSMPFSEHACSLEFPV